MAAAGLPTTGFELSSALTIALADATAEQRWLAGDDIFRDLPRNVTRPAGVDQVTRRIAEEIRG